MAMPSDAIRVFLLDIKGVLKTETFKSIKNIKVILRDADQIS